ncbi:MAG: 2-succinyl-5-enolpyruvyl-6-hydroxy-3-cyclohexene-1-carboxylic-acid synthase [Candidatus Marinimicrobia bacterium]|nr:2-succinyl-5-enolpyruvyl-6-hydroxy-3-cyclohexene-1-carboxylic-acid synthase [Candidatus Neomarinimicrobiota bacterium]
MMTNLDVGNLIVEEMTRLGVTQFVVSPGSRSTPLTVAIARHPKAKVTIHYDERGAAFFALGYARATGVPAVLVCTSGTAVANYFPAVIEASMDNIPMIVLTADRPPELIDVGANQAIFQHNIYGVYPRLALELAPAHPGSLASDILSLVDKLYDTSIGNRPGPVHLNCQFREPLLPETSNDHVNASFEEKWQEKNSRFTKQPIRVSILPQDKLKLVLGKMKQSRRSLIVVGRGVSSHHNHKIVELAEKLNLPVLADVQSPLRFTAHPHIINHFDLALLNEELQQLKPDFVLHLGGAFTSKRLLNYLNDMSIYYVSVKETPERIDPNHQVQIEFQTDITEFCKSIETVRHEHDEHWLNTWQALEKHTALSLNNIFDQQTKLSEPATSYHLSKFIPGNHGLMLANSMSIREMEMFGVVGHFGGAVFANRGSSGIDGLLATTAGYASGADTPVTLLIGDLACLHDLNSLDLIKKAKQPIILVVMNNDGGGIFNFLPVSNQTDVFEPFFGTPHGLTLEHAAAMFKLNYSKPTTMDEFLLTYKTATEQFESALIELITDRTANHQFHQHIFKSLREST